MSDLTAVVLAAGEGKRMKSALNKVLHPIAGRPLVYFPVRAAFDAGATRVVCVVSPRNGDAVREGLEKHFPPAQLAFAVQDPPQGTGDAARVALEKVETARVLILCGDTPLLRSARLRQLAEILDGAGVRLALTTCVLDDPHGYGRVLRDAQGNVSEVREQKDLRTDAERACAEINAGVYAAHCDFLRDALGRITNDNAQGEYYLTDVVKLAADVGGARAVRGDADALLGVNDRSQLAEAEEHLHRRIAEELARSGVTIKPGARIDTGVEVETDATIEAGVVLRGATRVRRGATIDVGSVLTDAEVGECALVKPYSVITESSVGPGAQIGPFAHLRPGSLIEAEAHIGNFVETKKTRVRKGAKANHLAYLGDGDIGEGANVGAGTIFCNYDGFKKHKTTIEEGAFIGSDSQIVAPVTIGKGAYVATGTTVTQDVPADGLAIGRTRQVNKEGYAARLRSRLAAQAKKG